MYRALFYAALRKRNSGVFGTSLSQKQVEGIEAVLDEATKRKTPLKWLAYMLATAYHETAHTMQPIEEYGRGKGRSYGKPGKHGQSQHGRGLVQLTWDYNYERADRELGMKGALVNNFNLALKMPIAVQIMFQGMEHGWFTGKKLSDFMDYLPMRKIINGMDKADSISKYAAAFATALRGAGYGLWVQPKPDVWKPIVSHRNLTPAEVEATLKQFENVKHIEPDVRGIAGIFKFIFAAIAAWFKRK